MSKYLNRKTEADDILFDSKKEAQTYVLLKARQDRGEISNLARQVPFVLIKKSKYGRTIKYIADFVFTEKRRNHSDGRQIVLHAKKSSLSP